MILEINASTLNEIHACGEKSYPEESVGLLLGEGSSTRKRVIKVAVMPNSREESARHDRYLLAPEDYLRAESQAASQGLDVLGVFHSHPDHPNRPSEFDREWALPWFSYLITSVWAGEAIESRSWRLTEDRSAFVEESIVIIDQSITY